MFLTTHTDAVTEHTDNAAKIAARVDNTTRAYTQAACAIAQGLAAIAVAIAQKGE